MQYPLWFDFKGIVHPQIKIFWTQIKMFLKMWVTNTFLVPADPTNYFSLIWKSMGTSSYLVSNILQGVFFYVQPKKETHAGLEQCEVE